MEQYLEEQLHCLCRSVRAADERAVEAAKRHWNGIAKPLYGLGRFEDLLTKVAGIQNTEDIKIDRKAVVVFCADNGVVAEGVTQTDSSVTAVVTENFARGIASVNRMASVAGADVIPVDIGVMGEIKEPGVRNCRIANGTNNMRKEPVMSREQALEALHTGIRLASELKDCDRAGSRAFQRGTGKENRGDQRGHCTASSGSGGSAGGAGIGRRF